MNVDAGVQSALIMTVLLSKGPATKNLKDCSGQRRHTFECRHAYTVDCRSDSGRLKPAI